MIPLEKLQFQRYVMESIYKKGIIQRIIYIVEGSSI